MTKKHYKKHLIGALVPLAIAVLWYWVSEQGRMDGLFPQPSEVWEAAGRLLRNGRLQGHIRVSFIRVMVGFAWAAGLGIPIGVLAGASLRVQLWFGPLLHFLRQIPPIAWIPLFILWFGIGEASKTAVIFYAAFFPVFLNTVIGVQQIPRSYWEVCRMLEFTPWQILYRLLLPGSAPTAIAGLRLALGMSWRALVAAEMLAASSGLGFLIMNARALVRLDEMVLGILAIGLIGVIADMVFEWLSRRLLPWNTRVVGTGMRRDHGASPFRGAE